MEKGKGKTRQVRDDEDERLDVGHQLMSTTVSSSYDTGVRVQPSALALVFVFTVNASVHEVTGERPEQIHSRQQ